jgi:uncharacterized zinc-type alcohol dehydrogenase-like protein
MQTKEIKAYGTTGAKVPLKPMTIKRRALLPTDVEMEILFCGICHSDLHQVHNDFGGSAFPMVPGHEMVGRITAVGEHVVKFKVGDLAGVGCIIDSCRECEYCKKDEEMFCKGEVLSFNSPDKHLGGSTYGGYAETYVADQNYVLHIPENLDLASAAPLLCAGITVYSPFRHWNVGPGKKVGVLGIGGLGHVAIKIAKAMGAEVIVFTTSPAKVADAQRLGAHEAVLTSDEAQMKKHTDTLDLILDTVSAKHNINIYLDLLRADGSVVLVGLPPEALPINPFNVVKGRRSFSGSNIGGIAETQEMLDFCGKHNITADIEMIKIQDINEAYERLEKGDVHYRFVIDMASLKN